MNEQTKTTLTNLETWKRGLFMLAFCIISGVAKLIVALIAIFQFVTLLFKGQTNEAVIPLGQNLSTYLYQITLFLTFKTDEMPFPFVPFPEGAPDSKLNEDNKENGASTEAPSKHDEEIIDVVEDDIKNETEMEQDKKNGPFNG